MVETGILLLGYKINLFFELKINDKIKTSTGDLTVCNCMAVTGNMRKIDPTIFVMVVI